MTNLLPNLLGALGLYESHGPDPLERPSSDLGAIRKSLQGRAVHEVEQGDTEALRTTIQAIQKLNRLTQGL